MLLCQSLLYTRRFGNQQSVLSSKSDEFVTGVEVATQTQGMRSTAGAIVPEKCVLPFFGTEGKWSNASKEEESPA
jgi:hypothetical protein